MKCVPYRFGYTHYRNTNSWSSMKMYSGTIVTWHLPTHSRWKLSNNDTISVKIDMQSSTRPGFEVNNLRCNSPIISFIHLLSPNHQNPFQKTWAFTLESHSHRNVIFYSSRQWHTLSVCNRRHPGHSWVWRVNGCNLSIKTGFVTVITVVQTVHL